MHYFQLNAFIVQYNAPHTHTSTRKQIRVVACEQNGGVSGKAPMPSQNVAYELLWAPCTHFAFGNILWNRILLVPLSATHLPARKVCPVFGAAHGCKLQAATMTSHEPPLSGHLWVICQLVLLATPHRRASQFSRCRCSKLISKCIIHCFAHIIFMS